MPDVGDAGFDLALIIVKSHAYNRGRWWKVDKFKRFRVHGLRFSAQGREGQSGSEGYLVDLDMLEVFGILKKRPVKDHIQFNFNVYFPESHPWVIF